MCSSERCNWQLTFYLSPDRGGLFLGLWGRSVLNCRPTKINRNLTKLETWITQTQSSPTPPVCRWSNYVIDSSPIYRAVGLFRLRLDKCKELRNHLWEILLNLRFQIKLSSSNSLSAPVSRTKTKYGQHSSTVSKWTIGYNEQQYAVCLHLPCGFENRSTRRTLSY